MRIELWTDGSGSRAGGSPIGYAWVLVAINDKTGEVVREKRGAGGVPDGTANRAELIAVLSGLLELRAVSQVVVKTDSPYIANNATHRLAMWQRNGWRTQKPHERREGDTREFMCRWCGSPGNEGDPCGRHHTPQQKLVPRDDGIVANQDLWMALANAAEMHAVTYELVDGDAGLPLNVDCDRRAGEARLELKAKLSENAEEAAAAPAAGAPAQA